MRAREDQRPVRAEVSAPAGPAAATDRAGDRAGGQATGSVDGPLAASARPLAERFDVALLDLDGVVYRGDAVVPRAAESLAAARATGLRLEFVTNNALRPPAAVAERLTRMGVPARAEEVATSAQAAATMAAARLAPGAPVLVLGGAGLREAIEAVGLRPVASAGPPGPPGSGASGSSVSGSSASDPAGPGSAGAGSAGAGGPEPAAPAAVVQGFDPTIDYARLAEAALAIRAGALWIASNTDATVPTERGLAPGNGSLVAALRTATGQEPQVAGKPERALHAESIRRGGAHSPLVVGDRLDTDIESANRHGTPGMLVFTGVTTPSDLLIAPPLWRPTFLARDLAGLLAGAPAARTDGPAIEVGEWRCVVDDGTLRWQPSRRRPTGSDGAGSDGAGPDGGGLADDGLDALRAACLAAWRAADSGQPVRALAADRPEAVADLTLG